MLILVYKVITEVIVPQIAIYAKATLEGIGPIIVLLVGMMILLSSVGLKVSHNLGSIIVSGIFKALGYTVKMIVKFVTVFALGILHFIPKTFYGSKKVFINAGKSEVVSSTFAVFISFLVVLLII